MMNKYNILRCYKIIKTLKFVIKCFVNLSILFSDENDCVLMYKWRLGQIYH
jgi:hypothetical protein